MKRFIFAAKLKDMYIIRIIPLLSAIGVASGAMAQAEVSDSLPAQELKEIVIKAPKVIRKADMDV